MDPYLSYILKKHIPDEDRNSSPKKKDKKVKIFKPSSSDDISLYKILKDNDNKSFS